MPVRSYFSEELTAHGGGTLRFCAVYASYISAGAIAVAEVIRTFGGDIAREIIRQV